MSQTANKIGVTTATIIGMNAMIGAGIFTAPAALAAHVGPAGILAYIFVIVAVWFMAQSLARLAYLFPEEGSFYTYARQWGGHTVGMIAVLAYFIGLLIAMGLLSQLAGVYLHKFIPGASAYTLGIAALVTLVVLNMFGVVLSRLGQHILICCTVFPLVTTILMCMTKIDVANLTPFAPHGLANVMKATKAVIFGFFGFESAASLSAIVQDPQKNVPRAVTYSIIAVGSLYLLFVGSIILSTPLDVFTDPKIVLSSALINVFPNSGWLLSVIDFAILSAIVGTIHSMIWGSSALFVALAGKMKNTFTQNLIATGTLNQRTAVLLVAACILTSYVTIDNLNLFFSLTALFIVSAYAASIITLLTIDKEWQSGQNIKTVIGLMTAGVIFMFAGQDLLQELLRLF